MRVDWGGKWATARAKSGEACGAAPKSHLLGAEDDVSAPLPPALGQCHSSFVISTFRP